MNFAGILGNAIRGGAAVVGQQAQGYIEDQRKVDVAQQLSQMEEEKAMRLAEAQAELQRKNDLIMNDPTGQHQTFRQTNLKTELQTRGDSAVDVAGREAQARTKVEQDAVRAYGTDPTLTKGLRSKAIAMQPPPQMNALEAYNFKKLKDIDALRQQISNLPADDPQREVLTQKINDLSGVAPKDKTALMSLLAKYETQEDALVKASATASTDADRANLEAQRAQNAYVKDQILKQLGYKTQPTAAPKFDTPTPESISKLKSNPALKSAFDARFGPGAADKILGGK